MFPITKTKGSFALGDDDDDKKNGLHGYQWDHLH